MTEATEGQATATPARYAILTDKDTQARVATLSKDHKLNQGIVVSVMLDMLEGRQEFIDALAKRREERVSSRSGKTALLKKLSQLSAEELAELAKQLEKKA